MAMVMIIIKIVLAVIFVLSVIGKLTGKTKSTFEKAGLSLSVMHTVAFVEIVLAAGLFTRFDLIATCGLLAIIGGAVFTLSNHANKLSHYIFPLVTGILLIVLLILQVANLIYLS